MAELDQKILEKILDDRFEKQAIMIKAGFDYTATKEDLKGVEGRLTGVESSLEKIDERLQTVEAKLDRALYTEYIHLEARVKRLEEKAGIKK
ncbi:MAG: hypothetical protein HY397_01440 [Candidatus Doudnabacteria bacterium]|nr:hypothetical protein [Candidatus Doudnabacteria bacterium]